jgi:hypothetical protein
VSLIILHSGKARAKAKKSSEQTNTGKRCADA